MSDIASEPEEAVSTELALLDGEDPLSLHRDDAEHWVAVYSELVESTTNILAAAKARLADHGSKEGADTRLIEREIAVLLSRNRFFSDRLSWWARRGRELGKS